MIEIIDSTSTNVGVNIVNSFVVDRPWSYGEDNSKLPATDADAVFLNNYYEVVQSNSDYKTSIARCVEQSPRISR